MEPVGLKMEASKMVASASEGILAEMAGKTIAFNNLSYTVVTNSKETKGETKKLLEGLKGVFFPGEMTALMGASGSGKTTLLDVLSGRKTVGNVEGDILLGSAKPTRTQLRHEMGYVEQFDTLVPTLTVEEMLMYTAELKRPQSQPRDEKANYVKQVVKELGLQGVANTMIGSPVARGVSGGQAKRVNIGLGMLTAPSVLFLDEPITGLDSATADDIMHLVHTLAAKGRTVVCSIHAPSSQVFRLFARMFLMQAGKAVFYGDPHKLAVSHFEACGFPFQVGDSIADYCVFLTGGGTRGTTYDFVTAYEKSDLAKGAIRLVAEAQSAAPQSDMDKQMNAAQAAFSLSRLLHELRVLLTYRSWSNYKDPQYIGQRLGDKILFSLLLTSLYWGEGGKHDVDSIYNTSSLLLLTTVLPSYGAAAYVPSLVLERPLFFRERNDGCFRTISYLLSKVIEEAVISTIFSAFYITVLYFAVDFQGDWFFLLITYYVTLQCGIMLGYTCGAVCPTIETANAVLPTYVTTCLFFMGFFILIDSVPVGWRWYTNLVHMRYSFQALMINNFENDDTIFNDGQTVLEYYGFHDEGSKWESFAYLCIFYCVFVGFAYIGLDKLSFIKR